MKYTLQNKNNRTRKRQKRETCITQLQIKMLCKIMSNK